MPPTLALSLWFIFLVALLRFDPAKSPKTSAALWVPVIWLFIVGSRLPSQWFGGGMGQAVEALEEGDSLDRIVFSALIVLAMGILVSRSYQWASFLNQNLALMALVSYALLSVCWSDFPFVAFKRWFKDLGNYLIILVVLSDPQPVEALRTTFRRVCYLLVPLSILLIKYYPQDAIHYSFWTGTPEYVGAATSKNMLGVLCMVSGIFLFWDIATRWPERKQRGTKPIILMNIAFAAMTLWLLSLSKSATSRVCLLIGCLVIAAAHSGICRHRPALLKVLIPLFICLYLILVFGFGVDINAAVAGAVGRDSTLTGRTDIWNAVLSTHTNAFVGAGYESFWLGSRLKEVWAITGPGINEAHNGYLEVYLCQGIFGLLLLGGFLIASYRSICKRLTSPSSFGSLAMALWTILLFYNVTESAFKGQLMWIVFLLGAISVPRGQSVRGRSPIDRLSLREQPSKLRRAVTV